MSCPASKLVLGALLWSAASPAHALCIDPVSDVPLDTADLPMSTLVAPHAHPTLGVVAVAAGNEVRVSEIANLSSWTVFSIASTVTNTPNLVQLSNFDFAIFAASDKAIVERWNIDPSLATPVRAWDESLRHIAECNDSITASPVVHLRRIATTAFQSKFFTDLVYAATRYGASCSDSSTANRIHALRADDGTAVWIFNDAGQHAVDRIYGSPYLDLANDRLYFGTEQTSASQDSLWAINVLDGSKVWSINLGPIWTTPMLRGDRLYVGTTSGAIEAVDRVNGQRLWTLTNSSPPVPIITTIFPEFRAPYADLIIAVNIDGEIMVARDEFFYGSVVWTRTGLGPSNAGATSRVSVDAEFGKLYVGADDGYIYQLSIVDGTVEARRAVDPGSEIGDISFVFDAGPGSDVSLIVGSSSGTLSRFCAPWAIDNSLASPGAQPAPLRAPGKQPQRVRTSRMTFAIPGALDVERAIAAASDAERRPAQAPNVTDLSSLALP